jgi:hypothetical protein
VLAELAEDEDADEDVFESADEPDDELVDEPADDEPDGFDAGELLDEEPRESLR